MSKETRVKCTFTGTLFISLKVLDIDSISRPIVVFPMPGVPTGRNTRVWCSLLISSCSLSCSLMSYSMKLLNFDSWYYNWDLFSYEEKVWLILFSDYLQPSLDFWSSKDGDTCNILAVCIFVTIKIIFFTQKPLLFWINLIQNASKLI